MTGRETLPEGTLPAVARAQLEQNLSILLKPISHPELGDVRIEDRLFAIGRTEAPFASFDPSAVAGLSRRHARIFSENGAVYVADLDSKNGTSVNGDEVRQKPRRLHDGDEITFGADLSYRVQVREGVCTPRHSAKLLSLTLSPEPPDLERQHIVIARFPFLISKADEMFSRHKEKFPFQVSYISRRHAHIFLKGEAPYIEDLGSVNGTFVNAKRLEEQAAPLQDGDIVAFGGTHFVYRIGLQWELESDPTLTKLVVPAPSVASEPDNPDKTTFVAAADSFLDIFCVDQESEQDDGSDSEQSRQPGEGNKAGDAGKPRGRLGILLAELGQAFADHEGPRARRAWWWGVPLVVALGIVALVLGFRGASERELKDLITRGEYGQATVLANQYLEREPDDAELSALATEALLKSKVPDWLAGLSAREFDRAASVLGAMKQLSMRNADAQSLVAELQWVGDIERFVTDRGGADAPIRIYVDEEQMALLLKRWDEDTQSHQRALTRISAYVPEFKEAHAAALSHLRKLQSDNAVYLTVIEQLKSAIATELNRDQPEALKATLNEYAEKYPRLGGLENVREDLRKYTEVENAVRARKLGPLVSLMTNIELSTPPFQAKFRALSGSGGVPSADVIAQYQIVSKAWRAGNSSAAFAELQKMEAGPWADAAAKQLEHMRNLAERFAKLEGSRGSAGYDEELLALYGSLHPEEDVFFIRALDADVNAIKERTLAQARELLNRAQTQWRQYQEGGSIQGRMRLEAEISGRFRMQARLLTEAHANAQQGVRIYGQLKLEPSAQWNALKDEINTEVELQRKSLQDLRPVLEPGLLKEKLAIMGDSGNEERSSP